MPRNTAGDSAVQAIINLAQAINPDMTTPQLVRVSLFAGQIVDQLVASATTTQIGQAVGFTGSQYPAGGSQNAPGNPGNPNDLEGPGGQGDTGTS